MKVAVAPLGASGPEWTGGENTTTKRKQSHDPAEPTARKETTNTTPDPADPIAPAGRDPYEGWAYRPDDPDIVAMVADWPVPDPDLAARLARLLRL